MDGLEKMVFNFKERKIFDSLLPYPTKGASNHVIQIRLTQGWRTGKHPESLQLTEHKPVIKTNEKYSDYRYCHYINSDWSHPSQESLAGLYKLFI